VIGGTSDEVWPEVYKETLRPGDVLLLSTDGLTLELPNGRISEILSASRTAGEATAALLGAANEAGGRDNVTAVVARFGEPPPAETEPAAAREEAGVPSSQTVSATPR
jgi:protein phosphatase